MSAADAACYVAKDQGRNRVHVYAGGRRGSSCATARWNGSRASTRALDEDRFVLFAQPIVPIDRRALDAGPHYELLLRLRDESGEHRAAERVHSRGRALQPDAAASTAG